MKGKELSVSPLCSLMTSSSSRCGPRFGDLRCKQAGECCDLSSATCFTPNAARSLEDIKVNGASSSVYCAGSPYDGPPRTICNPSPGARSPLTKCAKANEPTVGLSQRRPMPCGPAVNARCAWRKGDEGGDMCCVAQPDTRSVADVNQLRGECLPCADISLEQQQRVMIWQGGAWNLWSK